MGGLDNGGYVTGACYLFIVPNPSSGFGALEHPLTWAAARDRCSEEGGHLAEVNSEDEHGFLKHRVIPDNLPFAV